MTPVGEQVTLTDTAGRGSGDTLTSESYSHILTSEVRVSVAEAAEGGGLLLWPPSMQSAMRGHDQSALRRQLHTALLSHTQAVSRLHRQAELAAIRSEIAHTSGSDQGPAAAENSAISAGVARRCSEHLAADLAVLKAAATAAVELIEHLS